MIDKTRTAPARPPKPFHRPITARASVGRWRRRRQANCFYVHFAERARAHITDDGRRGRTVITILLLSSWYLVDVDSAQRSPRCTSVCPPTHHGRACERLCRIKLRRDRHTRRIPNERTTAESETALNFSPEYRGKSGAGPDGTRESPSSTRWAGPRFHNLTNPNRPSGRSKSHGWATSTSGASSVPGTRRRCVMSGKNVGFIVTDDITQRLRCWSIIFHHTWTITLRRQTFKCVGGPREFVNGNN